MAVIYVRLATLQHSRTNVNEHRAVSDFSPSGRLDCIHENLFDI